MQVLNATRDAGFRYLWRWGSQGCLPKYLAATRVLVFELDPEPTHRALKAPFERLATREAVKGPAGRIELEVPGTRTERHLSNLVSSHMRDQGVPAFKFMDEMEPQLAIARDSVPFHHDMPLWMSAFGAWCLDGPARELHFPMMGLVVPFKPGTLVVFDPAQPHGLLRPGHTQFDESQCDDPQNISFLNVTMPKEGVFADLLGCAPAPEDETGLLSTKLQYMPCPKTGHVTLTEVHALAA